MNLLDVVRELAELAQADHPAAALDRVELPACRAQCLAIAGVALELRPIFDDGVEHFLGLDEEDLEELGVEAVGVGGEQPLRLRRQRRSRRRDRCAALGDRGNRGLQRDGAAVSSALRFDLRQRLELRQRFLRLLDELGVVDQRGIVDQILELRGQYGARRGVGRRATDFGDEHRQHSAQVLDGVLDRLRRAASSADRDLAQTLRQQRGNEPLPVGTLLLQRLDEEPQPTQRLGEKLEVAVADRRVRVRIAVDLLLAKPEQAIGIVLLQHLKRAANLVTVRGSASRSRNASSCRGKTRRAPAPSGAG